MKRPSKTFVSLTNEFDTNNQPCPELITQFAMTELLNNTDGPDPTVEVDHDKVINLLLLMSDYIFARPRGCHYKYNKNSMVAAKTLAVMYVLLGSHLTQTSTISEYHKNSQTKKVTQWQLFHFVKDFRKHLKTKFPQWRTK
jgi:hypothetical protein